MSNDEQLFSGSCLCGSVGYEITGAVLAFYHCHCRRCRKASGTGHASNVIVRFSASTWTRGEDLLMRFHVPDAKRFYTCFCKSCGSPMPRIAEDRQVAVIAAGSLDSAPPLQVTARIFQDSRASWSCQADDLPRFDQYPPA